MKSLYATIKTKLALLLLFMGLATACNDDFLDKQPDDMLTLDMVFEDRNRVIEWLANCYGGVENPYPFSRRESTDPWIAISDELEVPNNWLGFGINIPAINVGNWNAQSDFYNKWADLYRRIRSIHIFLDNIHPIVNQLNQEEVDDFATQARFLRAYYYFLLWRQYGPVPLILEQIPSNATDDEIHLTRTPNDELVDWIDNEMKELFELLPSTRSNQWSSSPKKGAALAVRARMLLYNASPLFNGNPDFAETKNPDGTPLFNQTYTVDKWKKAADAAKELIDYANSSGLHSLHKVTRNGQIDPYLSYQNLFFTSSGEVIWAIHDRYASEWDYRNFPRSMQSWSGSGVTQEMIDAYFMNNGLPIDDPESGYTESGYSTADLTDSRTGFTIKNGVSQLIAEQGTFNMYINREPRFYVSVTYHNQNWYIPNAVNNRRTNFLYGGPDGLPHYDTPPTGYLIRKRTSFQTTIPSYFQQRSAILFRLGEVFLNYAEALNEYDPSNPDILLYINQIRERAGIPTYGSGSDQIPAPATQEAMREAIRQERQVELAFEGLRYFDLTRWKLAEDVLNGPIHGMDLNATNNNDFFKRTVVETRVFTKKMGLFPIPQIERNRNDNLTQNYGW